MDLKKLQKKYNVTSEELQKEIHNQADKVIGMLTKEITEPEATERVNNLKDLTLRNMKVMGIVNDDNKEDYLPIVFKSIVEQYWREKDLPDDERTIFKKSYTDEELKASQQRYLDELRDGEKHYKKKVKEYKKVIKEWWQQRKLEEVAYKSKLNGKTKHG